MRWARARTTARPLPRLAPPQRGERLTTEQLTSIFLEMRPSLERVIARRIQETDTAQDIAQNIYMRLDRISGLLPGEDDARRYLMRMAVNAALDHQRTENRHVQLLAGALTLFEGHVADPEEQAHAQDLINLIDDALADLPAKCRDVLYLTRIEGLPREEVAARLGVSLSLVNKYVLMALKHCKEKLNENGIATGVVSRVVVRR